MNSHRFYGVYRGSVFDNRDPYRSNRLRILVPQILGTSPTEWAWEVGTSSMKTDAPAIGQGVWVMFEGGDPLYPIWMGTFGKPPTADKSVFVKPLGSGVSLTGISELIKTRADADGSTEIDLVESLLALAHGGTTVSETAPSDPSQGAVWLNSSTGKRYTYYGTSWIQT